jgi:hypothetical protein
MNSFFLWVEKFWKKVNPEIRQMRLDDDFTNVININCMNKKKV